MERRPHMTARRRAAWAPTSPTFPSMIEAEYPLRIEHYGMVCDTGGPEPIAAACRWCDRIDPVRRGCPQHPLRQGGSPAWPVRWTRWTSGEEYAEPRRKRRKTVAHLHDRVGASSATSTTIHRWRRGRRSWNAIPNAFSPRIEEGKHRESTPRLWCCDHGRLAPSHP